MPLPWSIDWAGRVEEGWIDSEALAGNPLGDPRRRPVWSYVPPGYDDDPEHRYPSIYLLQGMTGQIDMWRNRTGYRRNFLELADQLFVNGQAPPCILVFVDCWTSYGGSQFLDSPATGRYHTYLCDEVVPWVDARYRTRADRDHRGVAGKSSGGYGAMVTAMLRPDLFGGLATHAGDALFEVAYQRDFPACARALRDHYDGSWARFWDDFRTRPAGNRPDDGVLINQLAMAACYSADPDGTIEQPFEIATGRLLPEVWERWLAWDPVRMVSGHSEALRSMRAIYIDAGTHDEYFLDLGAEAFRRELGSIGVTDVRFELFDAGHGAIEYRYPIALEYLAKRLTG